MHNSPNVPFGIVRPILKGETPHAEGYFLSLYQDYAASSLAGKIVDQIRNSKHYGCSNKWQRHPADPIHRIINVQKSMVENPRHRHSLLLLARAANLSPSWLSTRFKKICGVSIHELSTTITLCYALWRIICGEDLIKVIAIELGYKPLSFTEIFSKRFDIAPSSLRTKFYECLQ